MASQRKGQTTEEVLRRIVWWWINKQTRPTIREIALDMHMGKSTINWHVHRLEKQGLLHLSGLVPVGLIIVYEDPREAAAKEQQAEIDRKREEAWYDDSRDQSTQEGEFRTIRDAWEPDSEA